MESLSDQDMGSSQFWSESQSPTAESDESHSDEEGEDLTSEASDAVPDGTKRERKRQRGREDSVSPGGNLYMEALEYMWDKKKEAEALKEIKRQARHDQMMTIEKQKLEIERGKLELLERDLELRQWIADNEVMSVNISGLSEQQQQYYKRMQDEIIARRFGAELG